MRAREQGLLQGSMEVAFDAFRAARAGGATPTPAISDYGGFDINMRARVPAYAMWPD